MGRRPHSAGGPRAEIANSAARMLAEGSAADFDSARRKAAREFGVEHRRDLPDNLELHRALVEYLELFCADQQAARIAHLREVALKALRLLAQFAPVLVGPVLYGTAVEFTPVSLQLRCDEFESVTRFLLARRTPYELVDAQLRMSGSQAPQRVVRIALGLFDEPFELTVLPTHGGHQALSQLDGRAMQRADDAALAALLDSGVVFIGDFVRRPAARY